MSYYHVSAVYDEELIPEDAMTIRISRGEGEDERIYEIEDNRRQSQKR